MLHLRTDTTLIGLYRIRRGVEGHFDHPHGRNWMYIADTCHPVLAELVG